MTPPGMASRGPPPEPSWLTMIARLNIGGRRSRGRNYHISRRTRHELQAHHGHVALLNRPRAGLVRDLGVKCLCDVNACLCVIL